MLVKSNGEDFVLFNTKIIEQGEFSFNDIERREGSLIVIVDDHQYVLLEYLDYLESLVIHLNYDESLDKVFIKASTDMQESETIELVLNKK
ncbi:hypothetical protein SDC9_165329 [bioreactor metagenome]|uniref:Uncharacterized protein n=1 Tax=bioreactor metagenome TaxID=1076179 RepID=A0A645FU16_9ZZZZ